MTPIELLLIAIQDIPSVEGTKVLLVGVKATPSVKRFLYLSTIGSAVMAVDPQDSGEMKFKTTITRDDWNVISIPASHEVNEATGLNIYIGSKQKAEQLALQFMVDHNVSFTVLQTTRIVTLISVIAVLHADYGPRGNYPGAYLSRRSRTTQTRPEPWHALQSHRRSASRESTESNP